MGFLFVFQTLSTVIFFSAVTARLYYLGFLQKIVFGFAWIMTHTMRLSGSESLSAAANIFLGQTLFVGYLLSASIMNASAAIVLAKMFVPKIEAEKIDRELTVNRDKRSVYVIDALAIGPVDRLKLALNIGVILLASIAVIYTITHILVGFLVW